MHAHAPWLPNDPFCQSFVYQRDCLKNKGAYERTQIERTWCHRGSTHDIRDERISQESAAVSIFYRTDMNSLVMKEQCQRSRSVLYLHWSSLGELVLTVGLLDGSRPGCWSWLCHPPLSGISISSFEPPSMGISSSSHHSWRLLLLFKPPPLLWAASWNS